MPAEEMSQASCRVRAVFFTAAKVRKSAKPHDTALKNLSIHMTFRTEFQIGELTTVTAAYCTPLADQREFDGQFFFLLNRRL
jgi:hypothetical protein